MSSYFSFTGLLLIVVVGSAAGCSGQDSKPPATSAEPTVAKEKVDPSGTPWPKNAEGWATLAEQGRIQGEKNKVAQAELIARLKIDPAPIFDVALKQINKSIARRIGDEEANKAVVSVDKGSLKTFGPEKWKVRGSFNGNVDGRPRKTTWEAEVMAENGRLHPGESQLEVRH